jgi:hypothetical protein
MENNKPVAQREPTPYPTNNQLKNVSELGPLNSIIVPPLKTILEKVNLEIKDKKEPEPPMPIEESEPEPPMPIEESEPEPPMPIEEPEPIQEPKISIVPDLIEAEKMLRERELTPFEMPTPFEENIARDYVSPQKEIIIEEYIIKKPKAALLEEESMMSSMELVPNVRRSRKSKSKSASSIHAKNTKKYKRCKRNHRRSKKTHHCNKHCPPGHRKNPVTKSCRTIKN